MRIEERMMPETEETFDDMPECRRRAVQRLYDACKATFTRNGGPFSAQALQRVRSLLDNIRPSDVGLNEGLTAHGQKAKGSPPISYLPIYECEDFSMAIFCLPTSAVIPLHNHPGMTVLSKLLYGSMHVKAYDWVDHSDSSHPMLAKLAVDRLMSAPCESAVLYPRSGGNMHVFTAVTSCAVLDVLAPPYSSEDGRHCTYYRALPYANHAGPLFEDEREDCAHQNFAWLEECQPPDDFVMQGVLYKGPEIRP